MKAYYYEGIVAKRIKGTITLADHKDPYDVLDDMAWKKDSFFNDPEYEGEISYIEIDSVVEIERR